MSVEWVHPGLLLILGAWVLPFLKGRIKHAAMLILPAAALAGEIHGVLCQARPVYLRDSDAKVPEQMRQGAPR